jgi:hypothetical protein
MKSHRCFALLAAVLALLCFSCAAVAVTALPEIIISVPDQRMVILENGVLVAHYPVSTSKFGLGDATNSYATPLGLLEVAAKVGDGAPIGGVFRNQHFTGEVLRPNTPGRDPIVTRILHLRGLDAGNAHAFDRGIYIHGTPEESRIGHPASYGCIRMRSADVLRVFDATPVGTKIAIVNVPLRHAMTVWAVQHMNSGRQFAAN